MQVGLMLAVGGVAACASWSHVLDLARAHGQSGWLAWAVAACTETAAVSAGLEVRRRRRTDGPIGLPVTVLLLATVLQLAAQVAQAEPTPWGVVLAAVPAVTFLVLVKLALSRGPAVVVEADRSTKAPARSGKAPARSTRPATRPVDPIEGRSVGSGAGSIDPGAPDRVDRRRSGRGSIVARSVGWVGRADRGRAVEAARGDRGGRPARHALGGSDPPSPAGRSDPCPVPARRARADRLTSTGRRTRRRPRRPVELQPDGEEPLMSVQSTDERRRFLRVVAADTTTDPIEPEPIEPEAIEPEAIEGASTPAWGTPPAAEPIEGDPIDDEETDSGRHPDRAGPDRRHRPVEPVRAPRRPILPAWVHDRRELRATSQWAVGHLWHTTRYHAVRTPLYGLRVAVRAPVGAVRALAWVSAWAADLEGRPVRLEAARRADAKDYMKLVHHRDDRVRLRLLVVAGGALAGAVALVVLLMLPTLPRLAAVAVVVLGLARAGSGRDAPLTSRAVVGTQVARLTSDVIVRALMSLGLAGITQGEGKGSSPITFPAPITRDGPGWRADVDLPHGVTWGDVAERRDRLASGLRRPLGCVWPEGDPTQHAGRLVLWVGDTAMSEAKAPAWPLAKAGAADLFQPVPFGTDQRMRPVHVPLMYSNVLVGSMPGAGKTFALRTLLLAAALDPTAELWTFELKGSGDLSALEPIAHRYGSGVDDATIGACLAALREVHKELERRAATIARLPRDVCPENKVTKQLAARRSLGLYPLVVAIDECQELFAHPEHGTEAGDLCTAIIKRGRALGVILMLATQRPDAKSLPTGVSSNVGIRFCLRVMGQTENDMILGTSMYKNGYRATTFSARDKGIGYLVGATDEPRVARSAYLDGPTAERIVARAVVLRRAAGTITGHAAGEAPPEPEDQDRVLVDVLGVWPTGQDRAWSETLCELLSALDPGRYQGWGPAELAGALKARGVGTRQMHMTVEGKRTNRRGVDLAAVTDALGDRSIRTTPAGGTDEP